MFDVGDPLRNAVLTFGLVAIAILTVASVLPWKNLGAPRLSRLMRWVAIPVLLLAFVYETAMPNNFDIRVDLLLLLPMYCVVVLASIVRWVRSRSTQLANTPPQGR